MVFHYAHREIKIRGERFVYIFHFEKNVKNKVRLSVYALMDGCVVGFILNISTLFSTFKDNSQNDE